MSVESSCAWGWGIVKRGKEVVEDVEVTFVRLWGSEDEANPIPVTVLESNRSRTDNQGKFFVAVQYDYKAPPGFAIRIVVKVEGNEYFHNLAHSNRCSEDYEDFFGESPELHIQTSCPCKFKTEPLGVFVPKEPIWVIQLK